MFTVIYRGLWETNFCNPPFSTCSYDSEGRLTNVTFPTGVVTSLHNDMSSGAVAVDIETSGRDEDVSITTNLSSVDSFYTLVQGTLSWVYLKLNLIISGCKPLTIFSHVDQLRNSYQMGNDQSLRVIYANGMVTHYQTEPHILAGMLTRWTMCTLAFSHTSLNLSVIHADS